MFLDLYSTEVLCDVLELYDGEYDEILEMMKKDVFPQMEKPLCGSCAGEGICMICKKE